MEEQEIYDLQQGVRKVWDRCNVTAHFSTDHNVNGTMQASEALSQPIQIVIVSQRRIVK